MTFSAGQPVQLANGNRRGVMLVRTVIAPVSRLAQGGVVLFQRLSLSVLEAE
jgi:hypothetical protein